MINPHALRLVSGFILFGLVSLAVNAESIPLPPEGSDLVGRIRHVKAQQGDTLIDVAHRNSVGQDEIVMANPTPSRYFWVPGEGTKVKIPDQFILPDAPRVGIVVNVPEMRLYYYPPGTSEVITYPISIGRMDWKSPLGLTKIVEKIKDPTWTPPESIKREHALDGEILPDVVPAGPDNPLGQFAMRLGVKGSYLIHGTGQNKADGIGMMVTHGCMRMYPEDIAQLYPKVSMGTQVNLVNQPVKVGWLGDTLYIEVSQPLDEDNLSYSQLSSLASGLIQKKTAERPGTVINRELLKEALEKPNGIPTAITGKVPVTTQAASPVPQSPSTTTTKPPIPAYTPTTSGQPIRQPGQVATPSYPPRTATPSYPPRTATPVPTTTSNPSYTPPRTSKPVTPSPPDVPPGPPVTPAKTKPEQQMLPPIY
jgi:L,D-transpeptidase ErfK/SrfK